MLLPGRLPRRAGPARLAHFKAPREVTLVTELPKTSTGKIQKHALRQQARARKPGAAGPSSLG